MVRRRILTIEDDHAIRRGIVDALEFEGYGLLEASRGDTGLEMAIRANYDLLLLDLVLPGRSGMEILRELKAVRPTLPVIILTARGEEQDRVQGLKLGADDYVVKPFSVRELAARVEAVLRRSPERPADQVRFAFPGGTVDLVCRQVRYDDGGCCDLTEREAEMLRYLVGHAGRIISREEFLSRVWRIDPLGLQSRAIDMQIARLREKLRDASADPQIIRTIRGKGYLLAAAEAVS